MDDLTELARAARSGDERAIHAFVVASQRDVWRLCAYLVDSATASDLTQDTYLRALPSLRNFRGEATARTWLLSIARNSCADELRRRSRRHEELTGQPVDVTDVDAGGYVDLVALIRQLDPGRRAAFVLTQVLGCTYAEAAIITQTPIGTVRSRVARARADLIAWNSPEEHHETQHGDSPR